MLNSALFRCDSLSRFVGGFIGIFFLLTVLYSSAFMRQRRGLLLYYFYLVLTFLASLGAVFSNNFVLFIVFWGFSGLTLYLLIGFGQKESSLSTAKKAFIIIGSSDALMLLGLAFLCQIMGKPSFFSLKMNEITIALNSWLAVWAYLMFAAGVFAKAGVIPFHTWIPDTAKDAPIPVTAYLPASLDKLLGIYFLTRLSLELFQMSAGMNTFLMFIGSVTIIAAVMMALIQHDFKRLLGYHAVSQVGYMVLGIGTGNPIGIAGGLFHMLNNAIYKSCLFLSGGSVEKQTKTADLDKLGGLGRIMPITFITFLIASFAISGIPPFSGFFSKWMIYQGIIETAKRGGSLWVVWLIAAIFGSALTLASFMKLLHSIFLGQPSSEVRSVKHEIREAESAMWIPMVLLAFLCVVFGVFAYSIPLKLFISPSIKGSLIFPGIWSPGLATTLILGGILIGFIIYFLGNITKKRETEIFVGGETLKEEPEMRVSGVEFYNTVKDLKFIGELYRLAEHKVFDLYDVGTKITFAFTRILRYLHNGVLPTYLVWCLLGMLGIFYVMVK